MFKVNVISDGAIYSEVIDNIENLRTFLAYLEDGRATNYRVYRAAFDMNGRLITTGLAIRAFHDDEGVLFSLI